MQQYFAIIKAARSTLLALPKSVVNQKTVTDYNAKLNVLKRAAYGKTDVPSLLVEARNTNKVSTWNARRAAMKYMARNKLSNLLSEQDNIQKGLKIQGAPATATDWETWRALVEEIDVAQADLKCIHESVGPATEDRKKRRSKRVDMKGLPEEWRERVIMRMPNYHPGVLTAAICGCRPDELRCGIELSIRNGELIAFIVGSKVTEESGQEWRRLFWSVDRKSSLIQALVQEVKRAGGTLQVRIPNAKNFHSAVRAAGKRQWPRRKSDITPYCFRHRAAADMKASWMPDDQISMALGHCSDITKKLYGHCNMGSTGGVAPDHVEAARPVKKKKPSPASQLRAVGFKSALRNAPK